MKKYEAIKAKRVCEYLGLEMFLSKNMTSGSYNLAKKYNKFGDTLPFCPYSSLDDSMYLAMKGNLDITFRDDEIFIRPSVGATNSTCVIISCEGMSDKVKTHKVGCGVVECLYQIMEVC
jgi:hypothetical protein